MPVHVTTDTNQTISGDKTFTGLVSSQSGFIFPDGTTQTQAFVGGFMPLSGGDISGNMTVDGTISSSNQIYALNGNSSQWNNTFNVVQSNSATTWNYQGTDIKALTGNWQASYTALTSTSANWNDTRSVVQTNSAAWAIDNTTDTGVRALTSNWQNSYTALTSTSANWNDARNTVQSNSATTWNYQGTDVKALTGNWQNSYTALTSTSANWNDTRSTVQANSAQWATDNSTDTDVRALTANWQNTYSTVQSNSATTWNYQGTDVKALTSNWQSSYTALTSTSANWNDTRNTVQNNSATTWNPAGVYLPLSGGTISGSARFDSNVTIFGNLSCSGTQTFQNTIFSTTSAVSVVHSGSGHALWVGNNGTGDIASFYDIDANVEVLHVGGNNGSFPNVGVKTSTPNVDFTVNGAISASSIIYSASGNSGQWNSSYNTVQANSATTWNPAGSYLPLSGGVMTGNITRDNGSEAYILGQNSLIMYYYNVAGSREVTLNPNYLVFSDSQEGGGTIYISPPSFNSQNYNVTFPSANGSIMTDQSVWGNTLPIGWADAMFYRDGAANTIAQRNGTNPQTFRVYNRYTNASNYERGFNRWNSNVFQIGTEKAGAGLLARAMSFVTDGVERLSIGAAGDITTTNSISTTNAIYASGGNSNQWNSSYNTVQTNSATTWNYQGTDVKALTSNWQSSYTALTSTSANWDETRSIVQSNSATTWNYQGTDVKALTSNWQNSYTALTSTSASWNETTSTVQTNSASWAGGSTVVEDANTIIGLSMFL